MKQDVLEGESPSSHLHRARVLDVEPQQAVVVPKDGV
jgi:hypothetical protein